MADLILAFCLLYHPPNGAPGLAAIDGDTLDWIMGVGSGGRGGRGP